MFKMISSPVASTLPNIEAFCRTYETRSFSQAARALSVTTQATSRSVARLELALGVTLFRRTTRNLAPTEEAHHYYDVCARALASLADGERALARQRDVPGRVRISVPSSYGHMRLLPSLGVFHERHPRLQVEVHISNQNVDFVRDGYDLAIRMGKISDRGFVARKLGDFPVGAYASPTYLARAGVPRTPAELAAHRCIGFVMPRSGRVLPWTFHPAPRKWLPQSQCVCAEDPLGLITLARGGVGVVQAYDFLVEDDVARGSLVELLTAYRGATRPFSIIHPSASRLSAAARALKDFVVEREQRRARVPGH